MTIPPARFFHGTTADLKPGDLLLPGDEHGTTNWGHSAHVYATTTDFDPINVKDHWGSAADTEENRLAFAIDQAEQWAAYAADGTCTNGMHRDPYECTCQTTADDECTCNPTNEFHIECQREGLPPGCLRVYEIEPIGLVEPDLSTDVDAGVRMGRALVVRLLTATDKGLCLMGTRD